jgi:cell division septum initiation protein DivIVA
MEMDTILWNELNQVQQDLRIVQMAVEALQARVNELMSRVQEGAKAEGRPAKFTDLKGIWKGANFSYEEIQAAEYKVPEDWL